MRGNLYQLAEMILKDPDFDRENELESLGQSM